MQPLIRKLLSAIGLTTKYPWRPGIKLTPEIGEYWTIFCTGNFDEFGRVNEMVIDHCRSAAQVDQIIAIWVKSRPNLVYSVNFDKERQQLETAQGFFVKDIIRVGNDDLTIKVRKNPKSPFQTTQIGYWKHLPEWKKEEYMEMAKAVVGMDINIMRINLEFFKQVTNPDVV